MSPLAPRPKKPGHGPRYYRVPPLWGLVFMLLLVIVLIAFLLRLG
jgi:hypothetical protein